MVGGAIANGIKLASSSISVQKIVFKKIKK
jgi:hypothetical protein